VSAPLRASQESLTTFAPGKDHERENYAQQCLVTIHHKTVGAGAAQTDQGPGKCDAQERRKRRSQLAKQGLETAAGWVRMTSSCQYSSSFNAQAPISQNLASIKHSNDGQIDFMTTSSFFL
jgi:hypothetical protein